MPITCYIYNARCSKQSKDANDQTLRNASFCPSFVSVPIVKKPNTTSHGAFPPTLFALTKKKNSHLDSWSEKATNTKRLAMVIGNSVYKNMSPLKNAVN